MKDRSRKVQVWLHARPSGQARQFLVFHTQPKRGAFWQPVTGGVEKDETYEQAALREVQEETGLTFRATELRDLGYEFEFESRWGGKAREKCFAIVAPL